MSVLTDSPTGSSPTVRMRRPPATVLVTVAVTTLLATVGGYGAVYFTALEGIDDAGLTFLVVYEFLSAFALVSAAALVRRSPYGRAGIITYGVFLAVFNVFKIGYIREAEATVFLVAGLVVLLLPFTPSVRRYVGLG